MVMLFSQFIGRLESSRRHAEQHFVSSRGRSSLSTYDYEFITWGIENGASETDVDLVLSSAAQIMRKSIVANQEWDGFVNIYEFKYGPPLRDLGSDAIGAWITEVYWIYFDSKGRARKLTRYLHRKGGIEPSTVTTIDLETGSVETC